MDGREGVGAGGGVVCPRCGKILKPGYFFCSQCGWDLRKGAAPGPAPYPYGYPYPPTVRKVEPMALASFICGLASFFFIPLISAIAALALGIAGRNNIRRNPQLYEGDTYAVVGIILGVANIFITLVVIIVVVARALSYACV